jgi:hypothetical protein
MVRSQSYGSKQLEEDLVHIERAGKILTGWQQPAIVAAAKQSQLAATDATAAAGAT